MDRRSRLLPIPSSGLPEPKVRGSALDPNQLLASGCSVVNGLASELQASVQGMKEALDVLAASFEADSEVFLSRWSSNEFLSELNAEIERLPEEAGAGYFKFKGLIPSKIDRACAIKYAALLVLYSARALFLAERRGMDSVLASVDRSGFRYAHHLPEEGRLLIQGFAGIYSAVLSPELKGSVHQFISRVAVAFGDQRAHAALCVTFDLLRSCGRGASMTVKQVLEGER